MSAKSEAYAKSLGSTPFRDKYDGIEWNSRKGVGSVDLSEMDRITNKFLKWGEFKKLIDKVLDGRELEIDYKETDCRFNINVQIDDKSVLSKHIGKTEAQNMPLDSVSEVPSIKPCGDVGKLCDVMSEIFKFREAEINKMCGLNGRFQNENN